MEESPRKPRPQEQYNRQLDLFLPPPPQNQLHPQAHKAQDMAQAWKLDQQYAALFASFRASAPEQKAFS